jgi:tetratricopeptide (TPR) repeat protein
MHRNAYYFMGLSMFRTGNYEGAYETFERANDRIKNGENPYYLYMMGECLYAMDRRREARSKYIQARHAVRVSKAKEITDFEKEFGVEFWQKRNEERIADLEYLARAQGTAE